MTRMLPAFVHPGIQSNAEKKLFDQIKYSLSREWVCLHSLGISDHKTKVEGEIDFLLVGPEGVICLEVKGGKVERESGVWKFTNRYGNVNYKRESPFQQAASANYSLKKKVNIRIPESKNFLFAYGVVFTDIEFYVDSPEWDEKIILDYPKLEEGFEKPFSALIGYWKNKVPNKVRIKAEEREKIINYLRGDFELVESLRSKIDGAEKELLSLTSEQYKAIDRLQANKRIFFKGSAGTGKTLLAFEKAKREAFKGNRVLLLCFNKNLGGFLRLKAQSETDNIAADSIHQFMYKTIIRSPFRENFEKIVSEENDTVNIFTKVYPEFFAEASSILEDRFDYIILDEGQDLLNFDYLICLDYVLKGGWEEGNWAIFYDSNHQKQLYGNFDETTVEHFKSFGAVEYLLDTNCRNTKNIVIQSSLISGYEMADSMAESGEKVHFLFYNDENEQLDILANLIKDLISNKIEVEDIILLYPNKIGEKLISKLKIPGRINRYQPGHSPDAIQHSTVQSFKGLESKVIIYFNVDNLDDPYYESVNYVAMTRARSLLYVVLNEQLKSHVRKKTIHFLHRRNLNDR